MRPKVFISHNSADKPFARRLARDFDNHGVQYWLDEAEIKVGDSLIEKIRDGIDSVDYVAVLLSPESVASPWVQREVDVAMNQEILGSKIKVLPIMHRRCDPPGFLLGKKYADFTDQSRYEESLKELLRSIDVVFNRSALYPNGPENHLGLALDMAPLSGLFMLSRPFHRPFQYMGMSVTEAAKATGGTPNSVGNIIIDTEICRMCLEAEGNFISYVDVELKQTGPHYQDKEFDSIPILGALSINPAELELARKATHFHTYYDHRKRLKIGVACSYDGAPLSVGFSSKYYGM